MRIDVLMTVCEGSSYLPDQLASLREQVRRPDRLIVRDDASTDDSLRSLKMFQQSIPFAVTILQGSERIGSIRSFEQVLSLSDGDVVALSDQDDIWDLGKLARIEQAFEQIDPPGLVFTDARLIDEDGRPIGFSLWHRLGVDPTRGMSPLDLLVRSLTAPFIPGCTLAFAGRLRSLVLPFPPSLSTDAVGLEHDGWIVALAAATGKFEVMPAPLVSYRVHAGQQIGLPDATARRAGRRLAEVASGAANIGTRRRQRERAVKLVRDRLAERSAGEPSAASLSTLDTILEHLATRAEISRRGAGRFRLVARELCAGRYQRFSSGWSSALIDLVGRGR